MVENKKKIIEVGRRKSSVARVFLNPKKGKKPSFTINKKAIEVYFPEEKLRYLVKQSLVEAKLENKFDIYINVFGGGKVGQANACLHGISRALVSYSEELRPILKQKGFLTRDSREKERKKSGQPGARKRFQFSKR